MAVKNLGRDIRARKPGRMEFARRSEIELRPRGSKPPSAEISGSATVINGKDIEFINVP